MERTVLIAEKGMVYTDFDVWGTKIYLSDDKKEETFFQVPMESFIESLDAPEISTEHSYNNS